MNSCFNHTALNWSCCERLNARRNTNSIRRQLREISVARGTVWEVTLLSQCCSFGLCCVLVPSRYFYLLHLLQCFICFCSLRAFHSTTAITEVLMISMARIASHLSFSSSLCVPDKTQILHLLFPKVKGKLQFTITSIRMISLYSNNCWDLGTQ